MDHHASGRPPLVTLFVDNLPEATSQPWLKMMFNKYGVVKEVFIPGKRSKATGNRFGFIRYDCPVSADLAILKASGIWLDDKKLFVKRASFETKGNRPLQSDPYREGVSFKAGVEHTKGGDVCGGGVSLARDHLEARKTYAQVTKGVYASKSIQCQSIGNGWLYRSAVAKIRKLLSTNDLISVFNLQKVHDIQIKAIGGRYVVITFANEGLRDKILQEKWVMNWFEEIKPWNGEQAKEERFVWISCFGMPLSAWSSQTFKEIGNIWGDFLEADENTLKEDSYEKGKILIATSQIQRIEGSVELVVDGLRYLVRIEEEGTFRKVESSNFLTEYAKVLGIDLGSENVDQSSQVQKNPMVAHSLVKDSDEVSTDSRSNPSLGLESFVEDSFELPHFEPINKILVGKEVLDVPLACDSGDNIRASQIPGINLLVDFKETQAKEHDPLNAILDSTKIIPEEFESKKDRSEKKRRKRLLTDILNNNAREVCSPSDSSHSSAGIHIDSISTEDIARRNAHIVDEIEDLMLAGKRYGICFHDNDGGTLRKLMQLELEEQRLHSNNRISL